MPVRGIKITTISILAVGLLAGSAFGVAAQDELNMEAAEVTGQIAFGDPIAVPDTVATPDGILAFNHTWDTSDSRLTGDGTYTFTSRDSETCCAIHSATYELSNDGGSWAGDGRSYSTASGTSGFVTLSGRDGYEGLTAYVATELAETTWDIRGVIVPGALPEVPAPAE